MYLENNLIKRDKLTIASQPMDLNAITQPLCAVTAGDDHIAPWKQCYRIRKYVNVKAPVRFVLSTSGPSWGSSVRQPAAQTSLLDRRAGAQRALGAVVRAGGKAPGTWWDDWGAGGERTGELVPALRRRQPEIPPPWPTRPEPTSWKNKPHAPRSPPPGCAFQFFLLQKRLVAAGGVRFCCRLCPRWRIMAPLRGNAPASKSMDSVLGKKIDEVRG